MTDRRIDRWLASAKRGDHAAWEQLYTLAFPQVYRYVAAKVPSTADAEDVTDEVFISALHSAPSLRASDEPGFLAWLFQIARYKLADRLRRQYRQPVDALDPELELRDTGPTPEEVALQLDTGETLKEALRQLTPEQQEVILMKYVLGYDNARAAATLGKSPGAINQLQHRALGALRRLLEGGSA